jgi:hypothetical protein
MYNAAQISLQVLWRKIKSLCIFSEELLPEGRRMQRSPCIFGLRPVSLCAVVGMTGRSLDRDIVVLHQSVARVPSSTVLLAVAVLLVAKIHSIILTTSCVVSVSHIIHSGTCTCICDMSNTWKPAMSGQLAMMHTPFQHTKCSYRINYVPIKSSFFEKYPNQGLDNER